MSGPVTKVYRNNGDNTFSEQKGIVLPGITRGSVAPGDYNNDGKLDILLTGYNGSNVISKIYRNFHSTVNTPPAILTGLSATTNDSTIIFNWNRATGDATPPKGMSYNIRIGTTAGGSDIVSPMSLTNGTRLLPLPGNARSDTLFLLRKPKKATFYWSVQAIDNGFLGGPFTEEKSLNYSVSVQASRIIADSIGTSSLKLSWIRGNGAACAVFARNGSTGIPSPENGITYTANPQFGSGTQISTSGWFCIYTGTGNGVKVNGLDALTNYLFQVIEYDPGPSWYTGAGQGNPVTVQTNLFAEESGIPLQGVEY